MLILPRRRLRTLLKILKEYFDFCNREDRNKFYLAVVLGVLRAMFSALRITAVAVVVQGLIEGQLTSRHLWLSFGIMAVSVIGQILITLKTTMLQCEACYHSCCHKRIEIAEHLRYLPMGFFNRCATCPWVSSTATPWAPLPTSPPTPWNPWRTWPPASSWSPPRAS